MTYVEENARIGVVVSPRKANSAVRRGDLGPVPQYPKLGAGREELGTAGCHRVLQAYQLQYARISGPHQLGMQRGLLTSFRSRYAPGASPAGIVTL